MRSAAQSSATVILGYREGCQGEGRILIFSLKSKLNPTWEYPVTVVGQLGERLLQGLQRGE